MTPLKNSLRKNLSKLSSTCTTKKTLHTSIGIESMFIVCSRVATCVIHTYEMTHVKLITLKDPKLSRGVTRYVGVLVRIQCQINMTGDTALPA